MSNLLTEKIAAGWVSGEDRFSNYDGMIYATRDNAARSGLIACECNDREPAVLLYRYVYSERESYMVEIVGEQNGIWLKLQAYSLLADQVDAAIARLRKAWGEK